MIFKGSKLSNLKKSGNRYYYRGRYWTLDKPVKITKSGNKWAVLASKTINGHKRVKLVRFEKFSYGRFRTKESKAKHLNAWCKRCVGHRNNAWNRYFWMSKTTPAPARKRRPVKKIRTASKTRRRRAA